MLTQTHGTITAGPLRQKFAELLGAKDVHISWMQAIPNFMQVMQLFAPLLIERLPRRKPIVVVAATLHYGVWLIIAAIPWFVPSPLRPFALIAFIGLGILFLASQGPARQSWLTDLIPRGLRGRFLGIMSVGTHVIILLVQPMAGWWTDKLPKAWGLSLIFGVAVVAAVVGIWCLSLVQEPPKHQSKSQDVLPFLSLPLKHRDFRNLIIFFACRSAAVVIGATFFNWYLIHVTKLPTFTVTWLTSYQQALMLLSYPIWGHFVDRFGNQRALALSAFGNALFPLPWLFMSPQNAVSVMLVAYFITGLSNPGLTISQQNYLMRIAPTENRSVYFGGFAAIVNLSNACSALLFGQVNEMLKGGERVVFGLSLDSFQMLFLFSLIARLSCMVLLIPLRHAERRAGK
jgi:MFS family permease